MGSDPDELGVSTSLDRHRDLSSGREAAVGARRLPGAQRRGADPPRISRQRSVQSLDALVATDPSAGLGSADADDHRRSLSGRENRDLGTHGRIEQRNITTSEALVGYSTWPGLAQVFELGRHVIIQKTGQERVEVVYGVTSLSSARATPGRVLDLVRGHWSIENKSHWVRDVTFDEDRSQVRCGSIPQVMVLLPQGLNALKQVAKQVGLDLRGAYLNLDGGFDSAHNRKCIFNAGLIPNIKENPRNRKTPKRGRKRFFNEAIHGSSPCRA